MRFIEPKFEIIEQQPGLVGMYKQCETAGRVCYQSQDRINEDSYKKLLNIFDERHHYSPLAHGTVYLKVPEGVFYPGFDQLCTKTCEGAESTTYGDGFKNPMGTRLTVDENEDQIFICITTNYRVIKELNLQDFMEEYWCEPTDKHVRRRSVMFVSSRAIQDELMRHASGLAICCESTRYCTYSKDKFNEELKIYKPLWMSVENEFIDRINNHIKETESLYMDLTKSGIKAQEARDILPLDIACTTMYTGFEDEGEHVFEMRTSKAAHPEMRRIMLSLSVVFNAKGYTKNTYTE